MKINKKNWKIVAVCSVLVACFFAFSMLAFAEPAADASGAANAVWSFNDVISTIVQAVGALVSLVSIVFWRHLLLVMIPLSVSVPDWDLLLDC